MGSRNKLKRLNKGSLELRKEEGKGNVLEGNTRGRGKAWESSRKGEQAGSSVLSPKGC